MWYSKSFEVEKIMKLNQTLACSSKYCCNKQHRWTLTLPLRTFGVRWIGVGPRIWYVWAHPRKKMSIFLDYDQKLLPPMPDFEKKMPFHFSRPLVHIAHIECTSSSRSKIQYICSLPLRE